MQMLASGLGSTLTPLGVSLSTMFPTEGLAHGPVNPITLQRTPSTSSLDDTGEVRNEVRDNDNSGNTVAFPVAKLGFTFGQQPTAQMVTTVLGDVVRLCETGLSQVLPQEQVISANIGETTVLKGQLTTNLKGTDKTTWTGTRKTYAPTDEVATNATITFEVIDRLTTATIAAARENGLNVDDDQFTRHQITRGILGGLGAWYREGRPAVLNIQGVRLNSTVPQQTLRPFQPINGNTRQ